MPRVGNNELKVLLEDFIPADSSDRRYPKRGSKQQLSLKEEDSDTELSSRRQRNKPRAAKRQQRDDSFSEVENGSSDDFGASEKKLTNGTTTGRGNLLHDSDVSDGASSDSGPQAGPSSRRGAKRSRPKGSSSGSDAPEVNGKADSDDDEPVTDEKKSDSDSDVPTGKRGRSKKGESKSGAKRTKRKVITASDDNEDSNGAEKPSKGKGKDSEEKTHARRLWKTEKLQQESKQAHQDELERLKRLKEKQKEFNGLVFADKDEEEETDLLSSLVCKPRVVVKELVLDPGDPDNDVDRVQVHDALRTCMFEHQALGVKFMYDCVIEDVKSFNGGEPGRGCILAHEMGLGKTMQVISLLHTLMTHDNFKEKLTRVLVLGPKNVLGSWVREFSKWMDNCSELIDSVDWTLIDASSSDPKKRLQLARRWHDRGGVLITNYHMFVNMVKGPDTERSKNKKKAEPKKLSKVKRRYMEEARELLCKGPDMVVCDEAHAFKNEDTILFACVEQIETRRRLCLTGTPLQNNLNEYYTMVQWVRPHLLGSRKEFANQFANPIKAGSFKDSGRSDVRFMKQRALVLHRKLEGVVHRREWVSEIKRCRDLRQLPDKYEFVLSIRLCQKQVDLYSRYLQDVAGASSDGSLDAEQLKKRRLLVMPDFHILNRVWTHPYMLPLHERELARKKMREAEKADDSEFVTSASEATDASATSDADYEASGRSRSRSPAKDKDKNKGKDEVKDKDKRGQRDARADKRARSASASGSDSKMKSPAESGDDDGERDQEVVKKYKTKSRALDDDDISGADANGAKPPNPDGDGCSSGRSTPAELRTCAWWSGHVADADRYDMQLSGKLTMLFEIIRRCEEIGDKLLVFSQRTEVLNIIEQFLRRYRDAGDWWEGRNVPDGVASTDWSWVQKIDYLRLDGSSSTERRSAMIEAFNDPEQLRLRLMLISTMAGGEGISLTAANRVVRDRPRVIIFDASWNPIKDRQAFFRVYRFGQTKPVYVYRLVAQGTMEQRVYDRQVTKTSTSLRVVDAEAIKRHFTANDLEDLYRFDPILLEPNALEERPKGKVPSDRLLGEMMLSDLGKQWLVVHHEHDTLLSHVEDEVLSEEDQKKAWEDFEKGVHSAQPRYAAGVGMPNIQPSTSQFISLESVPIMLESLLPHLRHEQREAVQAAQMAVQHAGSSAAALQAQVLNLIQKMFIENKLREQRFPAIDLRREPVRMFTAAGGVGLYAYPASAQHLFNELQRQFNPQQQQQTIMARSASNANNHAPMFMARPMPRMRTNLAGAPNSRSMIDLTAEDAQRAPTPTDEAEPGAEAESEADDGLGFSLGPAERVDVTGYSGRR